MPRNGDGSSDNGPIEGHDIVHGASGDATIQHAKNNVAPMPEVEKGEGKSGSLRSQPALQLQECELRCTQ
ncbi:hypothetical protein N0V83_000464 [Neocucurbitaria cava]|uniref:Uncharacterized protein n=1 Tax=Neocucurbitaria cava TaxID=798079 RepID=A0A9W8YHW6_9PLEO|nr:hypothetical protein N0V83_000464 [Neocucurbitaria cava]